MRVLDVTMSLVKRLAYWIMKPEVLLIGTLLSVCLMMTNYLPLSEEVLGRFAKSKLYALLNNDGDISEPQWEKMVYLYKQSLM